MLRKKRNEKPKGLLRLSLIITGMLALLAAMIMNSSPQQVSAGPGDLSSAAATYPVISGTLLQQCALCHTAFIPSLNPYGAAYKAAGRIPSAFAKIENLDSDGDGVTNLNEIKSLTFPGDPASFPAVTPPTKTPVPPMPTATAILPTPGIVPTSTAIPPMQASQASVTLSCPTSAVIGSTFTCTLSINPAGAAVAGLQINLSGLNGLIEYDGAQFTALAGASPISLSNVKDTFVWAGSNGYLITQSGALATLTFETVRAGNVNLTSQIKAANASNAPIGMSINSVSIVTTSTASTSLETPKAKISGMAMLSSGTNPTKVSAALLDASNKIITSAALNADGTYALEAQAGTYTLRLSAPGYLAAQKPVTLVAGTPLLIAEITLLAGDINGDNKIDSLDLFSFGAAYEISPTMPAADLNGDGAVNLFDLTLLAKNWRKSDYAGW